MNEEANKHTAADDERAGIPEGFIHVEVAKDLELELDEVAFLAGLTTDPQKLFMSQPVSALFMQWYALAAFIAQAPDSGVLLDVAKEALAFLGYIINDARPGSGDILDKLDAWFNKMVDEEATTDEQST